MLARVNGQMRIFSFGRNSVLSSARRLLRLYVFVCLRFCIVACLFLSGSAIIASGIELTTDAEANLKKVIIRKPSGSVQARSRENIEKTFLVEVMRDKEGLRKGLSLRESMPEGHGMLFVLDVSQEHAFWMKGMRFPLDILFIGRDMKITELLENLQPCERCPLYFPKEQPAYALELNAGQSRKQSLSVGDTMLFEK